MGIMIRAAKLPTHKYLEQMYWDAISISKLQGPADLFSTALRFVETTVDLRQASLGELNDGFYRLPKKARNA
jgi:hypothetical protein